MNQAAIRDVHTIHYDFCILNMIYDFIIIVTFNFILY